MREFLTLWVFSPLQGLSFAGWRRFIAAGGWRSSPLYWPRLLFAGMTSINNSLQMRRERREFGPQIEAVAPQPPVFVLGHYRSGTTHLQNLLAVDERLAFPNYYQASFPHTFLTSEAGGVKMGQRFAMKKRPQDDMPVGLKLPAEEELALCVDTLLSPHMSWHLPSIEGRFRRYLTFQQATEQERQTWIEAIRRLDAKLRVRHGRPIVYKSPCHTARVPLILEAFPDARFIHIARDPFAVYQSTRNMEIKVAPLFRFQPRLIEDLDGYILWRYREMYEAYLDAIPAIPKGQLAELRYEELVADPVATLRRVYGDVGIDGFDGVHPKIESYLDSIKSYKTNRYTQLAPEITARIRTEWSRTFAAWGYDDRSNDAGTGEQTAQGNRQAHG